MSKIALACAVLLASLFTAGAQADAAGFKRHTSHAVHHYKAKPKFKAVYRSHKRVTALRRFQHRFVLKRHDRRIKAYRYVRRHR